MKARQFEILVLRDFKDFNMNGKLVGIGQLEVIDLAIFDDMKADLEADIAKLKAEGNATLLCLLLTDIMKEGSELLVASDNDNLAEQHLVMQQQWQSMA